MGQIGALPDGAGALPATNSVTQAVLRRARTGVAPDLADPRLALLARSTGAPLPEGVQRRMEQVFGRDFSHVRVHLGVTGAADALQAEAFTAGADLYFADGAFAPGTERGDELLIHELQHVVQAEEGRVPTARGQTLGVSNPSDPHEVEAERVAAAHVSELHSAGSDLGALPEAGAAPASEPAPLTGGHVASAGGSVVSRKTSSTTAVEEQAMGVPVSSTNATARTNGMFAVRQGPGEGSPQIGALTGTPMDVTVSDKAIVGDTTWYEVTFSAADAVLVQMGIPNPQTGIAPNQGDANQQPLTGWIGNGLSLSLPYSAFLEQLRGFEALNANLSVPERIVRLRQMGQSDDFPFDTVLGTDANGLNTASRTGVNDIYQLLRDAQSITLPDGTEVDIFHFLVGLEALAIAPRDETSSPYLLDIGSSYAASTWAGDVGAAAADRVLESDTAWETGMNAPPAVEERHYFESRAPSTDLLGDIDAWGAASTVAAASSVEAIITAYYGPDNACSDVLVDHRRDAMSRLLGHYGFDSAQGLKEQPARAQIQDQIFRFGNAFATARHIMSVSLPSGSEEVEQLWAQSGQMADRLLDWLEGVALQYGAVPAGPTAMATPTADGATAGVADTGDGSAPADGGQAPTAAFSSTFEITTRLPRSRAFTVGEGGRVQVECRNTTFVRPDRDGTTTDRYSVLLHRDNLMQTTAGEILFEVGQAGRATWNDLEPGSYTIEIQFTTAPVNPYETLTGDIDVHAW